MKSHQNIVKEEDEKMRAAQMQKYSKEVQVELNDVNTRI
jgi:hypothetical protein